MPTLTMLRAIFAIFKPTLKKLHDAVSSLTRFLEFKPDHMFGCILDRQACMPTFATFQAILTPFMPNPVESALRSFPFEQFEGVSLSLRHSKIFSPALSPTLAKPHNLVSCLTNLSKLKFNHRFIDAFGR